MRLSALIIVQLALLVFSAPLRGQTVIRTFSSPSGRLTMALMNVPSPAGPSGPSIQVLARQTTRDDLVPSTLVCESRLLAENHGYAWLNTEHHQWVSDKFLIFDDGDGLCVVDAESNQLLLNQTFTGYARSPKSQSWAAIRYRPTNRDQEQLTGKEKDTIWFIDPAALAANAEQSTTENPFAHVAAVQLDGIAIAQPQWSEDGTSVAIVKQREGKVAVDLFDPKQRVLVRSVSLPELTLTQEQLLSVWIIPEVDQRASEAIKASHVFEVTNSQAVPATNNHAKNEASITPRRAEPDATPTTSPPSEEPSSTPWSVIVVLIVAALGLLWLLLKRRS